jgi:hypothetical protein
MILKTNIQTKRSKKPVSIDGIRLLKNPKPKSGERPVSRQIRIHTSTTPKPQTDELAPATIHPTKNFSGKNKYKISILATSFLVLLGTFFAGMAYMQSTRKSLAEEPMPSPSFAPASISIPLPPANTKEASPIPATGLFNLTISQIEKYLNSQNTASNNPEALKLETRKSFLKVYLTSKKSPLVNFVDTIAGLKHWKVVLAISNSESSLGKRCADNNCSGIGVRPDHEYWREYEDKGQWAIDMDKLIEKRYKDWSLEEMNGVYNYPGSDNWVFAANQILEDLKGIE